MPPGALCHDGALECTSLPAPEKATELSSYVITRRKPFVNHRSNFKCTSRLRLNKMNPVLSASVRQHNKAPTYKALEK